MLMRHEPGAALFSLAISDFGLSYSLDYPNATTNVTAGTRSYSDPVSELLEARTTPAVDLWAAGMSLIVLLDAHKLYIEDPHNGADDDVERLVQYARILGAPDRESAPQFYEHFREYTTGIYSAESIDALPRDHGSHAALERLQRALYVWNVDEYKVAYLRVVQGLLNWNPMRRLGAAAALEQLRAAEALLPAIVAPSTTGGKRRKAPQQAVPPSTGGKRRPAAAWYAADTRVLLSGDGWRDLRGAARAFHDAPVLRAEYERRMRACATRPRAPGEDGGAPFAHVHVQ